MPPIHPFFLHCSIYFYPSAHAAADGDRVGATGFLVNIPVEGHDKWGNIYAITNTHVLDEGGLFIRLATGDDGKGVEVIETDRNSWVEHPERYDVVALELDLSGKAFHYSAMPVDRFITHELLEDYRMGPGDDAFLVGRLITPWGQQRNVPAVRFGNISMMADPEEPIVWLRRRKARGVSCGM